MLSSSRFDSMPAQPPTPPKDISKAVDDAISFLDDGHEIERALSKPHLQRRTSIQAAVPSPAHSQGSTTTANSKRVGFSPHTTCHQLPAHDQVFSSGGRALRRSPSTKTTKPLKSILKLTSAPPLTPDDLDTQLSYFSPDVPGSFAKMLQSVLSQLASDSVSNRLDAYMTLNGALQTYGDVPDVAALSQKLSLLSQFMARDMAWKNADGKLNTNIVVQALKLTNILLLSESISASLDADFRSFLIDRSITIVESSVIPKQIMKAHLHLLAQHKIYPSAMNHTRADKILNTLQNVEARCSGNSVIATRLVIYQRLLEQSPNLMLTRIRDWLEQTFHCMLSSISDIRNRAIDTCTKGGIRLGMQGAAGKALCDFLDTEVEEGQSYYEYFSMKMLDMLSEKESAASVPRIWSSLLFYFRNKKKPLDKWARFKNWLLIIQKCLNSSDIMVRYEATLAWNKVVYTLTFVSAPPRTIINMLKIPIVSSIDRRGNDQFSRQVRQYTLDCYHNLLHYGLKPNLASDVLESVWDILVEPILLPMVRASPKGRATACRIMSGFCSGNNGVWNPNAALLNTPIKSEDLPRLEPRWARSHLARFLKVLQPAMHIGLWQDPEANAALFSSWYTLMQTIADAGAQEVRTSNDLKQAIALLVGCLRQLWTGRSDHPEGGDSKRWMSSYVSLVDTMVTTIGQGHFTEDILATSDSNAIEVAPTPSTKRSKHLSAPQSPMVILLSPFFIARPTDSAEVTEARSAVSTTLESFTSSRPSSLTSLELLSRAFFTLQSASQDSPDVFDVELLWKTFSHHASTTLKVHFTSQQQQPGNLGQCLRYASDIFSAGLLLATPALPDPSLIELYDAMFDCTKEGSGEGGIVLAVMEPAAKSIMAGGPSLSLTSRATLTAHVLSKAVWPKNRQALESARKALWGVGLAPHKSGLFDPFEQVYALMVDTMTTMYTHADDTQAVDLEHRRHLFSIATGFLQKAPLSLLLTGLRQTQNGFAVWIEDEGRKTAAGHGVSDHIITIWMALLKLLQGLPSSDSNVLKSLEPLLVAGFASPHRQVVNQTILFWNSKFGSQESLEYPSKLERIIRARMTDVNIDLPNFPESNPDQVPATLPNFFESESQAPAPLPAQQRIASLRPQRADQSSCPQPVRSMYFTAQKSPIPKSTSVPNTIDRRSTASGSSTPKARLRHDDSQIQFAPIESSPIRPADESQHLTDHQREVTARQNQAAQMFPELSSSPTAQSTALPRALPKRLDFSSEPHAREEEETASPTALPDATNLMSDDLPSSPTPSSTRAPSHSALDLDHDQASDDEDNGPPSSPPRAREEEALSEQRPQDTHEMVELEDTTVLPTGFELTDNVVAELEQGQSTGGDEVAREDRDASPYDDEPDLPSDSILPAEQLQLEAEAAEKVKNDDLTTDATASRTAEAVGGAGTETTGANDVTRVQDSFVQQLGDDGPAGDEEEGPASQGSRRSRRKRKRLSADAYTAKKQKSASPFKRFTNWWRGSQQEDDDMEDEIVVASSQRSPSPTSPEQQQPTDSQSRGNEPLSEPVGEPTTGTTGIKQEGMAPPPKRRRGRPRKSETPTPNVSQNSEQGSHTRSLKRRASVLSNASTEASSSFVKDTTAPAKSRKGRQGQSASQPNITSSPYESSQAARQTRRTATAVEIPRLSLEPQPEAAAEEVQDGVDEEIEVSTPQKQLSVSSAAAVDERPKLTPSSILERLKDTLKDFVGMKASISTAETRQIDDTLFEFRKAAFEAESRGRAG